MKSMQQQFGILGTISPFAYRYRETKKNLCRGGWSQDLPDTDFLASSSASKVKTASIEVQKRSVTDCTKRGNEPPGSLILMLQGCVFKFQCTGLGKPEYYLAEEY